MEDGDGSLLRVVELAWQLNAALDVARLERVRRVFCVSVASAYGVDGGFSLTRDELECVLEYPPASHVDFLMAAFRANATSESDARVDLLTLLAAFACLARGALEAKAKFLFSLVDFDVEDEIVEDELAMVIALCSDGLKRLGLVLTELSDLDARALACEAFEFVEIDDGDKMNFAQFVRWLVSHWRPAALFDRIQTVFLIATVTRSLQQSLHTLEQEKSVGTSQVCMAGPVASEMVREMPRSPVKPCVVEVGPVVGRVTTTTATLLFECDILTTTTVTLTDRITRASFSSRVTTSAKQPVACVVQGLAPGRLYDVSIAEADRVDGLVQTPHLEPAGIRIIILADDAFCSQSVHSRRAFVPSSRTSLMNDILAHLANGSSKYGSSLMFDMTIRMGAMVALRHDLLGGYELMRKELGQIPASRCMEELVRTCYKASTASPDNRALLSRGAHCFTRVGLIRSLLQNGTPVSLLKTVARVVHEYEQIDVLPGLDHTNLISKLSRNVDAVVLDTTACLFASNEPFVSWPEQLLTPKQISAVKTAIADVDVLESSSHSATSRQVLVICDAPFVWPFIVDTAAKRGEEADKMIEVAADPWYHYTADLKLFLSMIFGAIHQSSLLRITLVCNGPFATRVVITDKMSGRSVEQLTVGTLSNIERQPPQVARYGPDRVRAVLGGTYTIAGHPVAGADLALKQYCLLDIVPHSQGSICNHSIYTAGRPDAKLVLGPVIGRVTTRTARILVEVDRWASKVSCVMNSLVTGHSVSLECDLEAFVPTVFKVEGLHPGIRYRVNFEGVMEDENVGPAYVETPAPLAISVEWLVFSQNNLRRLLPDGSRDSTATHWPRILAPGTRSSIAQLASKVAKRNEDSLGESRDSQSKDYNPWYHVEDHALSEPLRQTQLSIHIGGQVDLSNALPESELSSLIGQLCDSTISDEVKEDIYKTIRFRLQEVYRITWGVEPMRTVLAATSNVMLLRDESDLFFSTNRLQALLHSNPVDSASDEDQVARVAFRLRALAFELWQLYQNQLLVDVNESDLDNSRRNSSKFASYTTLGMCRLLFLNVSDELRDACSNKEQRSKTPRSDQLIVPLTLPAASSDSRLPLFSSATWRVVDEAIEVISSESKEGKNPATRSKVKTGMSDIKQLVVFIPVDLLEIVSKHLGVRPEITHLLEKMFEWKMVSRTERQVHLVTSTEHSSSINFTITDEKVNESVAMTRVASISYPTTLKLTKSQLKTNVASKQSGSTIKGHFSKRFSYESTAVPASGAMSDSLPCRSYARYLFLCDYRRGYLNENLLYFPSKTLSKIVVGPVIGRFLRDERDEPDPSDPDVPPVRVVTFSVRFLIESNAPARLTCVVIDSMLNTEIRVTNELLGEVPHVFLIHGLVPLRRYVYFFEGASNSEDRRGCFHTPTPTGNSLNLVVVSSNFPTHMDEEQDSLWVPLLDRAKLPWCGIDAILHLGGQVPLHEAAIGCLEWVKKELSRENLYGSRPEIEKKQFDHLISRVRRRFQQEYYVCWNLPNIRELLANASHWFLPSKSDVAPFFGWEARRSSQESRAISLVLDVAKEVVFSYQIQLVAATKSEAASTLNLKSSKEEADTDKMELGAQDVISPSHSTTTADVQPKVTSIGSHPPSQDTARDDPSAAEQGADRSGSAQPDSGGAIYWQDDDIAIFVGDMRAVSSAPESTTAEPITCNGRLSRGLSPEENPIMDETQWKFLETVLRKKRTQLLVLCFELPLILTNAEQVEKLRDELRHNRAADKTWKMYDHTNVLQHWVACKRQLEQLLLLLFKWKAKRSGRDVLILSGGMRVTIDTMVQDRETKLSLRNLTVGPVTANVETFEFPLSGVACGTFAGGVKDDHFTFRHSLLAKKNYLLLQLNVQQSMDAANIGSSEGNGANVVADFVPNEPAALNRLHPKEKFRRYPAWWTSYVPLGKSVFWDDTITLKSETDERMLALREFLWHDRGISGVLEVLYEKYEFAETARMEDLRSRHLQHIDLQANFISVLAELWRAIPDAKRRQMAYFLDPFVRDMLMAHVAPNLFTLRLQTGEPIEFAFFCRVIREFVFDACLLRLTIITQQEDEIRAHKEAVEQQKRDAEKAAQDKEREDKAAREEAERMVELLHTDPLEYAKIKVAHEEAEKLEKQRRHQVKLERKKAERLAELEEGQAIAKEQKRLNRLAEHDATEYERRQQELDARVRKLVEKRAQRAAQKRAAVEKAENEA